MVDRSGQPDECNSSKAQIRTLLESKDRQLLRNISKESVITNSKQLKPKKSADSFKDNDGNRNWNFVKLMNEVLQRWKNYGNSEFCLRYYSEKKTHRGSEHYLGTLWQSTGIAK